MEVAARDKLQSRLGVLVSQLGGKAQSSLEDLGGKKKQLEIEITALKDEIEKYSSSMTDKLRQTIYLAQAIHHCG